MTPSAHLMASWLVSHSIDVSRRERILITLSGVVPDIDGVGYFVDLVTGLRGKETYFYQEYHHAVGHSLLFGLVFALVSYWFSSKKRVHVAVLCFAVFHLHLLADIVGSLGPDGYNWPIKYLWPSSGLELSWSGQWLLNGWQNILIAALLFLGCAFVTMARKLSPFELISVRLDKAFFEICSAVASLIKRRQSD
ncbi:MAG: metal-dependent hydrolase [Alphaproteobacteria bacterium]|nr:MAG: metal-dependent hydrolase [Alphaproteobacteria bacterium]